MKITSKVFIVLAIIALALVPVVGCAGPAGPTGPQGEQGVQGLQGAQGAAGEPGPTRQIVVTYDIEEYPLYCAFAVVDVYVDQLVRIKGAGFTPGDEVTLTCCEDNTVLDLWELDYVAWLLVDIEDDVAIANDCGAFEVYTYIPDLYSSYWPPVHVSVRAWLNFTQAAAGELTIPGDIQCVWPLNIWPMHEFLMRHSY